jgi:DNA polymerase III subunit alpha
VRPVHTASLASNDISMDEALELYQAEVSQYS